MDLREIGVVIPAYNAEKTVGEVIKEIVQHGFARDNVIVINDGSRDKTEAVAKSKGVTVVNHKTNRGKGAALRDGFTKAQEKGLHKVFVIDADAQHEVSEVEEFLKSNSRYDIIIGERKDILSHMPLDRRLTNRTVNLVVSLLSGIHTTDVQCGFRYINLKIFDKVQLKTSNYQTESEMVIKAARNKYTVGFVPVSTIYHGEKSYINPLVDTMRFVGMAVRFLWR
jgi:glycosyltransferase involved in cell wall biosynthesis